MRSARRVQGQQICLVGDPGHGLDDVANVGRLLFQLHHHAHRIGLALRCHADVCYQAGHVTAGSGDQRLADFALAGAQIGVLQLPGIRD